MQSLLEKVLSSKETPFQDKRKLLDRVITAQKTPDQKADILRTILESLLHQHNDYPHRTELICETLAYLTALDINFMDTETHLDLLRDAPELELSISWINHIARKQVDKTTMNSLKTIWVKKLNKSEAYWQCNYFKDLIAYKEKQLKIQESKHQNSIVEEVKLPLSLQFFNHQTFFYRIKITFEFMVSNQSFQSHGIDLREVYISWLLTLKTNVPEVTNFVENLIAQIIDISEKSSNHYVPCFKAIFRATRFQYTPEDVLQPHYSSYELIKRIRISALEICANPYLYDQKWDKNDWSRIFKNLIRIGLSENVGLVFISLCKNFAGSKYFELLTKVQEDNIGIIIPALKVPEWQDASLSIIKYLLKDGPVNSNLMRKVMDKLFKALQEVDAMGQLSFAEELGVIIYHLSVKYSDTVVGQDLTNKIKEVYVTTNLKQAYEKARYQKKGFYNWSDPNSSADEEKVPFRGLNNIGNTCYMNSFLQALYMTKEFRYRILNLTLTELGYQKTDPEQLKDGKIDPAALANKKKVFAIFQLQKVFALLMCAQRPAVNPAFLKSVLPDFFKNSLAQQDSSEFGKVYLDEIERSIKETTEKNLISELFTGETLTTIECKDCGSVSKKSENFLDMGAHFDETDKTKIYSLKTMLMKNFEDEKFEGDNSFFCEKCEKKSTLAIRRTIPKRYPPVLMITLHRFYFDLSTFKRLKLVNFVDTPTKLSLTVPPTGEEGVEEELNYSLFAAVVHRGSTLDFGHYYSIAKDDYDTNQWTLFDDSTVKVLPDDTDVFEYVKKHNEDAPYILFYHQIGKYGDNKVKQDFKLNNSLSKIIEQDNLQYLKEVETSTKAFTSLAALNLSSLNFMNPYRKDNDDDDNDPSSGNQMNNLNGRFIC